ncbi:lipase family protein [Actinokineospora diospyrosa]|uniref:Secretory lipase n=1 Tax=Actinokineospora diospyrosa TaxID=103728 RepID=A0ABT1IAX6_9PSEU|nr:lipase family protein [Actinokineospora diospyrosa]MCP2269506.1 Secretory lipase [Actinokineospora diospyrosa]
MPINRKRLGPLALAITLVVGGAHTASAAQGDDFYTPPATLPAHNGDLVRTQPAQFYLDPARLIRADGTVTRVMYRSTDRTGTPIAVTGTVITPRKAWGGPGERPVIGYAAGTQGLGDQCAPSRQLAAGMEYEGPFVAGLLARGWAVALTDYQGLGTPGGHTYMSRVVQGTAVLDSIRAARQLPELPDRGPVAVVGYSQGGGAAASAAELASGYAPELDLRGVSAGAVPADLADVGKALDGSLYAAFVGYAVAGLEASYGIDASAYLNDRGKRFLADIKGQCLFESIPEYAFARTSAFTLDGRPLDRLLAEEPFRTIVAEQVLGKRKPAVPVLVTHSLLDDVIPYATGRALVDRWCGQGANVRFATNLAPTHVGGAVAAYPEAYAFLEARFAGRAQRSTC